MTIGVQRGLNTSTPFSQRQANTDGPDAASAVRNVQARRDDTLATANGQPADTTDAPKADAATVQGARERALAVEESFRQRLETNHGSDTHHRKGHIRTRS
jgi:hypothetical protein